MGGKRETPTERERERTEDTVSMGPSPPPLPGLHLLGAARYPHPQGSGVMAKGIRDQTPVLREPFPSSDSLPQGWPPIILFRALSRCPLGPPKDLIQTQDLATHPVQV